MDGGAWWATVHGVTVLDTTERLNHHHCNTVVNLFVHKFFFCVTSLPAECGEYAGLPWPVRSASP